jgi:TolB-like protein
MWTLVEAETGKHVWAERHGHDLTGVFAAQCEITEAVPRSSQKAEANGRM